ncbi:hypothetical protein LTR91_012803 [Friedmanniomyces endolithicus]|uniref:Mediator of RNA polymerase II transcription subunit 4 n=1 Tax=Friedmanniomyces endolithicus TaxID=329885 RepID=A0AAN6QQ93_9PEZI|nr:hypothetical protein LTR94_007906 [Friedmanniomyces endolithicus]KAK0799512.1 hypothetical protein LTR38_007460 [Friedmanniomyces endolithicus]KAK0800758.1 hypothetical protein LTR59_005663 [Friedmanniomyces endolithicus]KAK0815828.1 hypothetical protein LTR75_003779 [Friedmanniomyces endolithicus]KAK0849838.1 hypothetical protein LTR03_005024 [Friedmanniomyces endolithicus]
MLSQFQASYRRMDQSLQRLTDSIAAYNPSTAAADELVAADDALNEDLATLIQHQRNVLRIEELKRIAQDNDDRIKSHFRAVAELRKELAAIPSMNTNASARSVSIDELLSYARFISPTTLPPTFRKQDVPAQSLSQTAAAETQPHIANGIATPPLGTHDDAQPGNTALINGSNIGTRGLKEEEKAWLDSVASLPFLPWPEQPTIANGALGQIQLMLEHGKDPATVLSPAERAAEEERRRVEEEAERAEEEEKRRRRVEMFDAAGGRKRDREEEGDVFDPDA